MSRLTNRDFLKETDFTSEDLIYLLDLAAALKKAKQEKREPKFLLDKNIVLLFEKDSTRTRCSFEVAAHDQGAHTTYLGPSGSQIGKKEAMADTARVLSGFYDGIEYRGFGQSIVEELAKYAGVPVWNGLTNEFHPTQILADMLTIREHFGSLKGRKLVFLGDCRYNMANSLIVGGLKVGMNVAVATPDGYKPDGAVLEFTKGYGDKFALETDPFMAASGADILITDTWTSMGEEAEKEERKKIFKDYQINRQLLAAANAGAMVQHCLPAYRGQEITEEVFEEHADEIFNEAENRLHAQKAVMVKLMKKD